MWVSLIQLAVALHLLSTVTAQFCKTWTTTIHGYFDRQNVGCKKTCQARATEAIQIIVSSPDYHRCVRPSMVNDPGFRATINGWRMGSGAKRVQTPEEEFSGSGSQRFTHQGSFSSIGQVVEEQYLRSAQYGGAGYQPMQRSSTMSRIKKGMSSAASASKSIAQFGADLFRTNLCECVITMTLKKVVNGAFEERFCDADEIFRVVPEPWQASSAAEVTHPPNKLLELPATKDIFCSSVHLCMCLPNSSNKQPGNDLRAVVFCQFSPKGQDDSMEVEQGYKEFWDSVNARQNTLMWGQSIYADE